MDPFESQNPLLPGDPMDDVLSLQEYNEGEELIGDGCTCCCTCCCC